MKFYSTKFRTIREVCILFDIYVTYDATSMAIFSPYIRGRIVIKVEQVAALELPFECRALYHFRDYTVLYIIGR